MVTPIKHVIPGPDLLCAGPQALRGFCNIFLPNITEDQKKFYYLSAGRPGTEPSSKYGAGFCITLIKSLDKGLRKQLLGQNPLISPGLHV